MVIPLKVEKNTESVAATIPPSLKAKLDRYCEETGSKQSAAIRHILSFFLEKNYGNFVPDTENTVADVLKSGKSGKAAG